MKTMRRSWSTILLVTGLVGLLVLLAGLQYRWLSRIGESDGEKARARVKEQTERFAADFNREIQNAYFNFQTGSESWKRKDWTSFNEQYDFWREKTAYPDLITDFYFFAARSEAAPLRYDRASRSFEPSELTAELARLRSRFSDDKSFKPVYEDAYTLVLPVHDAELRVDRVVIRKRTLDGSVPVHLAEKFGYIVIKLDAATIQDKILPDLAQKYFGDGEFRTRVTDTTGQPVFRSLTGDAIDAAAPLFDLSPDNFMFFANRELMSSIGGEKRLGTITNSHVESRSFDRVQTNTGNQSTVKIEVKTPRTSVFTTTVNDGGNGPWTLQVQHSSGSLETYLANTLRRNLVAGFGILLLLAAAVGAIIFSAHRAKRLAQRQVDFVSSVSHEFRTPLAVIQSAGENLADGVAKEDGQVSLYGNLIKGEGKKLLGMVEQILDFAGANSGRKKYNFRETSIADVIASALDECRPMIDERDIQVEMNVPNLLPPINGDAAALSQAVQNLIVNSIKYGNGERWLRVTAENGSGSVKISVEDRGMGISKSDLKQVFEPFYRSSEVVEAQIHGNGLGLSLVKQITEAHGGKVTAVSGPGRGSAFTIELPV